MNCKSFLKKAVPALRERINAGGPYENCVKDAVSAFDSLVGKYVEQLILQVPITEGRRNRLENKRFHNLKSVAEDLKEIFDATRVRGRIERIIQYAITAGFRRGDNPARWKGTLREPPA